MSDDEDPYAVSSDSDDDRPKGPPPKVAIEGAKDLKQLKEAILAGDEKKSVKDEKTMEEIEELRRAKADEMKRMKQEFEEGTAGGKTAAEEAAAAQKESLEGVGKENLASMKNMFEKEPGKAFTAVDDEEKQRQLEEIKSQVSSVKQMWKTGHVEGASAAEVDGAKQEELDALKRGTNLKERFQPQAADGGEVQKCYDRSELDTAAIADARKSFVEGSAYQSGTKAESAAAGELGELKFTEMNAFKDRFEKAQGSNGADSEAIEKARIELDLQLKELRKNFEKPESEMSPEEQAAKKKAEIEAEFARYKLARKMAKAQTEEDGGEKEPNAGAAGSTKRAGKSSGTDGSADAANHAAGNDDSGEEEEFDVKNLMNKFKTMATDAGTTAAGRKKEMNLVELEALRMEAKKLREQFEQVNRMESSELGEEKRLQLEEEFKQIKGERERAKKALEEEQAEAAAAAAEGGEKEDIQVAAEHASKMAAKWEKIQKKEAKKAEKSRMPQK